MAVKLLLWWQACSPTETAKQVLYWGDISDPLLCWMKEIWRLRQLRKRNTEKWKPNVKWKNGDLPLCRLVNSCPTPRDSTHIYSCTNRIKSNTWTTNNREDLSCSLGHKCIYNVSSLQIKKSIDFKSNLDKKYQVLLLNRKPILETVLGNLSYEPPK